MADLNPVRNPRQMLASGLAGLFGLFAGLCAIFAACATLYDWHQETAQARWPVVSAIVDRADVVASRHSRSDGSATMRNLRIRIHYEQNGQTTTATLGSRTVMSDDDYRLLQAWTAQHRRGSQVEVRYDPSQPDRALLVSDEISPFSGRIHNDLVLLTIFAAACAGLLALAKFLRARELRAAPVADDPQRAGLAFAALPAAIGLLMTGLAIRGAVQSEPFRTDDLMGVPIGLMFLLAGILIGLPPQYAKWRSLLATLLITCFAITFDWVAFGPGERHFTGSAMGIGFIPGEMMGRIAFGLFAVILDVCAIGMWIAQLRRGFRPDASAAPCSEVTGAFSSEVETGSRQENASNQESRAPFRFNRNGIGSSSADSTI
jgi:hypothetical protein